MAEAPDRKVCRCQQRGHGDGGQGSRFEVKELKGTAPAVPALYI